MAYFDYGLNLELKNFQAFLDGAKNIDATLDKLASSILSTASALEKVDSAGIKGKATALSSISLAYKKLGEATAAIDPNSIINVNKAISSGAQVKTIEGKAEAMEAFAKQAQKLSKLPDLSASATQISTILTAFAGFGGSLGNFKDVDTIAGAISALASAFKKMEKISISTALAPSIAGIATALGDVVAQSKNTGAVFALVKALEVLFKALRTLGSGAEVKEIPSVLAATTTAINSLVGTLQGMNKNSYFGGDKIVSQIREIAVAFRDLGVAIRSYGGVKGTGFDNVEANIKKALDAFKTLVSAFQNTSFADDISKSVTPATQALVALGGVFETLGRKKGFEKFPETIDKINQAIKTLDVQGLQALSAKIQQAIPTLKELAEVAKAVSIVNSQAGRAFVQASKNYSESAKAQKEASISARQLLASYIQLTAAVVNLLPALRNLLPSFSSLVGLVKNVAVAIASISFKTVQAGFTALRFVLIGLPLGIVQSGINGVGSALRILATVVAAPIKGLRDLGAYARYLNSEFKLVQTGVNVLLAPFRLLQTILTGLITVITGVVNGFSRLLSGLSPFSRSAGEAVQKLRDANDVGKNVSTVLKGTGEAAAQSAVQINNYNTQVQGTSKFVRVATLGLQVFAGALASKGVTLAVTKLVNMQIAFRALDTLSRAAASGLSFFSNALTNIVSQAFQAAAEFQRLQISISVLLGREQVQLNPGMFTDTLAAAKTMTDEADKLLEKFQLLAVASPFTTTDIAEGFRMAQVYGFSAVEAEKLTNATVDLAAGLGLAGFEIAGIIQPLGQMQQVGKANLQDLKQLATRGVPVFDVLAKEFGVTTEKIRDMISDGLIPADRAINAIVTSFAKDFKGAAAASTQSLSGLLSTAQDLRATSLREFFTPIFEAVLFAKNEGDFALADMLSLENLQSSIKNARDLGQAIAVNVNSAFQTAVVVVQTFLSFIRQIPAPVIAIVSNILKFTGVVLGISIALGALNVTMVGLTSAFFFFVNPISLVVAALVAMGIGLSGSFGAITAAMADLFASFGQIPQFITAMQTAFNEFNTTGKVSETTFAGLTTTLQIIGKVIFSTGSIVKTFVTATANAFLSLARTGKAATDGFAELPGVIRVIATEFFSSINVLSGFISAILNIPATLGNVTTSLGGMFRTMLAEFVTWGANIVQSFADGISGTVDLIAQALQAIGGILTFWLAPGSPPKIAPDLDSWGASAALQFVTNFVSTFLESLGAGFSAIGAAFLTFVGGTLANALGSAVIVLSGVFTALAGIMIAVGNQIYITVVTLIGIIQTLADSTLTAGEKMRGVLNLLGAFIRDSFFNLANVIDGVVVGVTIALGGLATFIVGEFVVAFLAIGKITPIFESAANSIINFVSSAESSITSFGDGVVNYISDVFDNVSYYGSGLVQSFADGIVASVSYVADALQQIGDLVTFWLEPGSPPRLLPDIDQWGTAAASEFLEGFNQADFDTIGDFGDTVKKILESTGTEGVDAEKIVQQFSQGIASEKDTGDFGAMNFAKIADLAGAAGPEIADLALKYAQVAKEQSALAEITNQYDKELQAVQGTLDDINTTEGIEMNQAKVESLTNALGNTLLTQNERTRIQQQIQKLQAETRIKQLEAEKKAQERNVGSAEEALTLQKEQLQLADKFDNTSTAITNQNALSGATEKAAKIQDKLTAAQLKYQLSTADTAGKIEILRAELSKMDEGSVEYYNTLTQIQKLEEQLARERETEAKKGTAAANKAITEQDKINKAELDYRLSLEDTAGKIAILREELAKTQEGSADYYKILKDITTLEKKLGTEGTGGGAGEGLFAGITEGAAGAQTSIAETVSNANKKVQELQTNVTNQFNAIKTNIKSAIDTVRGYLDTWIFKNDIVKASLAAIGVIIAGAKIVGGISAIGASLALLSNPVTAVAAALIGLTAAFAFFAVSSGGIEGAIAKISDSFITLQNAFTVGATTGQGTTLDFSSFDMAIATLGINIGAAATNLTGSIGLFFTNLGNNFTTGFTALSTFLSGIFTGAWNGLLTVLGNIFGNQETASTALKPAGEGLFASIETNIWIPFIAAFTDNGTLLGKISAALIALGIGIATILYSIFEGASIDLAGLLTNNPIGQAIERNINETVNNLIPFITDAFDLSETITAIGDGWNATISTLSTIGTSIGAVFTTISDAYTTFTGVFTGAEEGGILSNIISENQAAFAEFIAEVTSPAFISGLQNIAALLGIVAGVIATVAAVIIDVAIIGLLKNIGDIVIEVGAGIGTLSDAFALFLAGDLAGGFSTAFLGIQQILEGVFGNIADILADAVKALLGFFNIDTSGTLGTVIDTVADLVVSFFSFRGIISLVVGAWSRLVSIFQAGVKIIPIITALFAKKAASGNILINALKGIWSAFTSFTNLISKSPALLATVISYFIQFPKQVSEGFSSLGGYILEKIKTVPGQISDFFINWVTTNPLGLSALTLAFNFVSSIINSLVTSIPSLGTTIQSSFALIDLSWITTFFSSLFNFETPEIIESLKTKISTTIDSAIAGITTVAFNIADAIFVSEEEQQKLADNIKGYLPNFDTLFGEGTTDKVALNLADIITINEAEVTAIKDTLTGVIDTLIKFSEILPLPESFKLGLESIKAILTGELSLTDALTNIYNNFVNIGLALAKEFANPFGLIKGAIDGLSNPITLVSDGFLSLKETISGLLEIDLSGFTSVFAPVTEAFTAIGEQITNLKSGIEVLNLIPGVDIGGAEVTGGDAVQEKIKSAVGNKTLTLDQKLEVITDDANLATESKKLLDAFVASYEENTGFTGITNFSAVNADLIEQGFTATNITDLALKFGKEVPAGLAEGMADTDGTLSRESRGLATNLLDEIASELGIQSPSTKARDDIGIPFVQGIALGLEDYTVITTALGLITASMISTVTTALSEASLKINIAQSLFTLNEAAVQVTRLALENISNLHVETFGRISDETIPNFVSRTEEQFTNSFDTILGLLEEFAEEMITTIENLSTDVIDALGTMRTKIANLTNGFKNVGKDLGEALMEGIINAIEDQTDAVIGAVNTLFGDDGVESTELLDKSKASGVKIGKAFTEGVAEGILAPTALAAIKQAVEEMIQQAEDAAKKAAGVESPSTLFRDSIGKNLTAGIGIGMMDGLDGLTDITKNIINSIYLLTKDEIGSQFTTGITDGIQSQQTALNTTVTNLLDNSVLAAKTQLQINSPSRVTNKSIGVPYVDGILTALEGGRGRLSNVAGSLLDVLPLNQTFKYNVEGQVAKQPVELQYSNLMTALPQLTQNVALQGGNYQRNLGNAALSLSGRNSLMSNTNMESVNMMTDSRSTSLSNYTVNNYEMTVMTTPERAARVEHNFDAMRLRRRI
jgi:tape measure domain-containing protein